MPTSRLPDRPRTARERVAQRHSSQGSTRHPRRARGGWNRIVVACAITLVVLGLIGVLLASRARQTLQAIEQFDPRQGAGGSTDGSALPDTLKEPFNVLLVGIDQRPDPEEGVRSDTLILVHVDPVNKKASMLSIPRDSVVQIPHVGEQKVNTAYSYGFAHAIELYGSGTTPAAGGGALVAETVESFLGVRVHYIAQIDFHGFEQIVDTLGGVLVDVPLPLLDAEYPTDDYGVERIYVPAGLQVLDGHTALRYARSRHSGSDFDRSRRQQRVLRAILDDVRRRGVLDQVALMPDLARDIQQNVATTLPISDLSVLRGLASLARQLKPDSITQLSINPDDVALTREEGSDLYWSQSDVRALVQRLLTGQNDSPVEVARVQVQNGAGVQGLAGRITADLARQGFTTNAAGDAASLYEHTLIIDYSGRPKTRQRLAELLGIDSQYVQATPADDAPPAPYQTDIVVVLGQDYKR